MDSKSHRRTSDVCCDGLGQGASGRFASANQRGRSREQRDDAAAPSIRRENVEWIQNHIAELAMSAAMAWGAGLRLYLVVFIVGLLGKFDYVPLPDALKILSNPLVLGAAGFMTFVEFFADKIPWLDSAWDAAYVSAHSCRSRARRWHVGRHR
jgi:Domain of unknown function (DUF4126)